MNKPDIDQINGKRYSAGNNYRSVLKSTSLIGGSTAINLLILMVRTKFVATLIGPTGVGLLGLYGNVAALIGNITRMGVTSSGVRQIAEAVGSHDQKRITVAVLTVRRTAWLTGLIGLLTMVVFSGPISSLTFGSTSYSREIAIIGITLLAGAVTGGQTCILVGHRKIEAQAKLSIAGAIVSSIISIPCYYFWGQSGIVPSLVFSSVAVLAITWWFARQVVSEKISLSIRDSFSELRSLISLGGIIMCSGLTLDLANYLIRIVLMRHFSLSDVGIFQAAFNLSGILVGFVLSAISLDYYPRLTAVANDTVNARNVVNEQTQISLLLSLPLLAAMMVFAPMIIKLFYTASFAAALPILRWCVIGILARILAVTLSYLILAKGEGKLFFLCESTYNLLHLGGVFLLTKRWGLEGAGIAFSLANLLYVVLLVIVMHRLVGAGWSASTMRQAVLSVAVLAVLLLNSASGSGTAPALAVDAAILCATTYICLKSLSKNSGIGIHTLRTRLGLP